MSENEDFLAVIRAEPNDHMTRLIYADWLDEQGRPGGAFLRYECEWFDLPPGPKKKKGVFMLQLAGIELARDWLAAISRVPIENCGIQFKYQCPKRWELLQVTSDVATRFCEACQRNVHFCETIQEARQQAMNGHCVAIDARLTRLSDDLQHRERMITMGVFDPEPERDIWLDEINPTESTDSTVDAKYYDYQSGAFGEGLK